MYVNVLDVITKELMFFGSVYVHVILCVNPIAQKALNEF